MYTGQTRVLVMIIALGTCATLDGHRTNARQAHSSTLLTIIAVCENSTSTSPVLLSWPVSRRVRIGRMGKEAKTQHYQGHSFPFPSKTSCAKSNASYRYGTWHHLFSCFKPQPHLLAPFLARPWHFLFFATTW